MYLNPSYKVVDNTWLNRPQALEIRINPGVRGLPWFVVKSFGGKITKAAIEGFPMVKTISQYTAYNKAISNGLHEWMTIFYIIANIENPVELIEWLETQSVVVGQNVYRFSERSLKEWEKPFVRGV